MSHDGRIILRACKILFSHYNDVFGCQFSNVLAARLATKLAVVLIVASLMQSTGGRITRHLWLHIINYSNCSSSFTNYNVQCNYVHGAPENKTGGKGKLNFRPV